MNSLGNVNFNNRKETDNVTKTSTSKCPFDGLFKFLHAVTNNNISSQLSLRPVDQKSVELSIKGATEMTGQLLRALATLLEDLGSILPTVYNSCSKRSDTLTRT